MSYRHTILPKVIFSVQAMIHRLEPQQASLPPRTNKEEGEVNVKFWQIIQAALFWQWSQKMFASYQRRPSFTGGRPVLESSSSPPRLFIFLSALSLSSPPPVSFPPRLRRQGERFRRS